MPVIPAQAGIQKHYQTQTFLRKPNPSHPNSSYRSRHCGFAFSINTIFQARLHSLMAFSLEIALSIVSCTWYHTRVCTSYRLVKPSAKSFLCSQTLRISVDVTPK